MSNLPYLFALAVTLAAMLASIAIWAPRGLAVKVAALACTAAFMPVAYAGYSDLLSRPKPVSLEWWQGQADEATVLGSQMREGESLYLWLQLPGASEPRAYELPWNQQMAQELQQALEQAARDGTEARMRLPFEPTLDNREPKFYAAPQPAMPPKDLAQPPAQIYQQPGQNA
jgi:hypothetical protein